MKYSELVKEIIIFEGNVSQLKLTSDGDVIDKNGTTASGMTNKLHAFNLDAFYNYKQAIPGLIRIHASDVYEKRVVKKIVDALVQSGKFKIKRWYNNKGHKVFELKTVRMYEAEEVSPQIPQSGEVSFDQFTEDTISDIKKLIRKGAEDLEQKWPNALALVQKAFEVANLPRPTPDSKKLWKQYKELIEYAVEQLTRYRGIDGDWRITDPLTA